MKRQGLPLTPALMEATYEYLRATPPFSRWRLPHADDIEFRVTRHRDRHGQCVTDGDRHIIVASEIKIRRTHSLIELMAHEMVHVHCHRQGEMRAEHGAVFRRHAATVCRYHGFDPGTF